MKIDDIIALAKAGFSADQILQLSAMTNDQPAPAPETPAAAAPQGEPDETPAVPENPTEPTTPAPDFAAMINAGFAELTKKLMPNGVSPSMGDVKPVSVDDIISRMLNE